MAKPTVLFKGAGEGRNPVDDQLDHIVIHSVRVDVQDGVMSPSFNREEEFDDVFHDEITLMWRKPVDYFITHDALFSEAYTFASGL